MHDLLAYLAERMIEMNKEKNAEIKGFLRWLEGEIGAPVEELTNKTALKEYYEHDFEGFFVALAKNKKKLKEGYDPTRREPKEKLQAEFYASVGKLIPLLKRIEATDGLIDAIVYKLYGLNEDEIKIVEVSISGGKDAKERDFIKEAGSKFKVLVGNPDEFVKKTRVLPIEITESVKGDIIFTGHDYEKMAIERAVEVELSKNTKHIRKKG